MPVPEETLPANEPEGPPPGERTFAELDALLDRAATEVQRGLEEGAARIGRYTLVTPVGEGGFGTVWMASQEAPVRRLVALKVFRRDLAQGMVLSRFENERQTLAMMDHPNVATVLDAGVTEDGRPWFAMPLIDGLPITHLCDERTMPVHERVRLMAAVCDGVQHAHQKGIIHRDLKPGNILVNRTGPEPLPRVIDFGVAKALEGADPLRPRTADGQRLGTPQYMPPEQWLHGAAMADARSDVYALGAVLGELLVGGPPTRLPRGPLEVPEVVPPVAWFTELRSRDPAAATAVAAARGKTADALLDRVAGDLDAIVRRATASHPDDRYPTAQALAEDLRRWLDGMPVSARLLSPWEVAWRHLRRHRLVAGAVAVAVAAVAAVAVVWATSAAERRRDQAAALAAAQQAERTFQVARTTIDELVERVRLERDAGFAKDAFARIETVVDRIADEDPLTAGRLAALVARGHLEAWDGRAGYSLLERSFDRVLEADPGGASRAFHELLPEIVRMAARFDRGTAAVFAPIAMREVVQHERLTDPRNVELCRTLLHNWLGFPFYCEGPEGQCGIVSAQWLASMHEDPVEAARLHAQMRFNAFMRRDGHPDQVRELRAAIDFMRRNMHSQDLRLVHAESWLAIVYSIHGYHSDDHVGWHAMVAARLEALQGRGAPPVANAYWNLACSCANADRVRDAYETYLPHLWPTYRRQSPRDGLRPWYLAYFAPIAYRACEPEVAYEVAVTQICDEATASNPTPRDGNSLLSAQVLAAVLADWGDEDGARDVERRFGVARFPPSDAR